MTRERGVVRCRSTTRAPFRITQRSLVVGIVLAMLAFASDALLAQSATFSAGVEPVPLTVIVTDLAGRHVPNLTEADFAFLERGRRQLMTLEMASVDEALRSTRARGNRALYDSLYILLRQYQQERQTATEPMRGVVVLLSDGMLSDGIDTSSRITFDDVLDLARRVGAAIHVVSLADEPTLTAIPHDDRSFDPAHAPSALARESGDRLFKPRVMPELVIPSLRD